jgi:hypothetical protein
MAKKAKKIRPRTPPHKKACRAFAAAVRKMSYEDLISLAQNFVWAGEVVGTISKNTVRRRDMAAVIDKWAREYA